LPDGHIVLLNRCPSLDKMEEIIFDGQVLGSIIFDPPFGEKIIIRPPAAARMQEKMRKSLVKADDGALPSIRKSSNLMGPGVLEASSELEAGSEVAVTDEGGTVVATGIAKKSGTEMMERGKGVAVKIRWVAEERDGRQKKKNDWDMVVRVNSDHIEKKVQIAKNFIIDLERKYRKPIAVSFSGGKDSLVTLHLALEAGVRPDILFANTGLELEETVSEIQRVAEETGLRLLWEDAGEAFWDNLDYFGPPGKDFRWCCKICKLGPTTRLISKNYPDGVISLIGQRSYESEQRMRKGSVWINPWVPGQIGASPIQKWPALLVWLFIFSRNLQFNPWYERGLDRIGCYLCPSSDIAELDIVKNGFLKYSRWEEYLEKYRESRELPEEWGSLALWRWKRLPPAMRNRLRDLNVDLTEMEVSEADNVSLRLRIAKGYRPCTDGEMSTEGVFSRRLDIERVANLLNVLGPVELLNEENIAKTDGVVVFGEGGVSIKEKDEKSIDNIVDALEQLVARAMFCVGCGICIGRCKSDAISLDYQILIDPKKCIHCRECLGECPVQRFEKDIEI